MPSKVSVSDILSRALQIQWSSGRQPLVAVAGDEELVLQADEDVAVRRELDGRFKGHNHSRFEDCLIRIGQIQVTSRFQVILGQGIQPG